MKLTRTINKTETLSILPCPACGTDVMIRDCGYSTFNAGVAECCKDVSCGMKWDLDFVQDKWDAGLKWNELCRSINHKLHLLSLLEVKSETSISRDFAREDKEQEAKVFKEEIRLLIIEGKI